MDSNIVWTAMELLHFIEPSSRSRISWPEGVYVLHEARVILMRKEIQSFSSLCPESSY